MQGRQWPETDSENSLCRDLVAAPLYAEIHDWRVHWPPAMIPHLNTVFVG